MCHTPCHVRAHSVGHALSRFFAQKKHIYLKTVTNHLSFSKPFRHTKRLKGRKASKARGSCRTETVHRDPCRRGRRSEAGRHTRVGGEARANYPHGVHGNHLLWDPVDSFRGYWNNKHLHTSPDTIPRHCQTYHRGPVRWAFSPLLDEFYFRSSFYTNLLPLSGCCPHICSPWLLGPPLAAYSHSASVGRRYVPSVSSLSFAMNCWASSQETFSTGHWGQPLKWLGLFPMSSSHWPLGNGVFGD